MHKLSWGGELARHAAFVAGQKAPRATMSGGLPLEKPRANAAQARARILAVLADGSRHKHAELGAAVDGLDLSRVNLSRLLRRLRDQGRIEAFGNSSNRWFQLA